MSIALHLVPLDIPKKPQTDLLPFAYTGDDLPMISQPWSEGIWTYATDGACIVRVPRQRYWVECDRAPSMAKYAEALELHDAVEWVELSILDLVELLKYTKNDPPLGVLWGRRVLGIDRLLAIQERLPDVKFAIFEGEAETALTFSFNGTGRGLLMPWRADAHPREIVHTLGKDGR